MAKKEPKNKMQAIPKAKDSSEQANDQEKRTNQLLDDPSRRAWHRQRLVDARRQAYDDAEAFPAVIGAIEELGCFLHPEGIGLGSYRDKIVEFARAREHLSKEELEELERLLFLLTQSRNDYAHRGAAARNIAKESIRVALLLEECLMTSWENIRFADIMATPPVFVRLFNTLNEARTLMLQNAFSYLPVETSSVKTDPTRWKLLSDRAITSLLLKEPSETKRKNARRKNIGEILCDLQPEVPRIMKPEDPCTRLTKDETPPWPPNTGLILVVDDHGELVGVVSPSDLM